MTTHVNTKEKSHKLFELIDYYEICNRAEGKSPKTDVPPKNCTSYNVRKTKTVKGGI
jgi:hypothetical protein